MIQMMIRLDLIVQLSKNAVQRLLGKNTGQLEVLNCLCLLQSKPWKRWYFKIMAGYVTFILTGLYLLFWAYMRFFV